MASKTKERGRGANLCLVDLSLNYRLVRYGFLNLKNIFGSVMSIVAGETVEFVVHGPITFVACSNVPKGKVITIC